MNQKASLSTLLLAFLIATPFVFAWPYVRPEPATPQNLVIAAAVGGLLSAAAYAIASWIVTRRQRRGDRG